MRSSAGAARLTGALIARGVDSGAMVVTRLERSIGVVEHRYLRGSTRTKLERILC